MARIFHKEIGPLMPLGHKYNCIILPGRISLPSYHSLLGESKEIVLWLHNNPHEFLPPVDLAFFRNPDFHRKLKLVIVVSEFAKKNLSHQSGISLDKIEVIHNVVSPVDSDVSKFRQIEKPRLIYTSAADRGLRTALSALSTIERDFVFDIYGDLPEGFLDSCSRQIRLDDRFHFHGKKLHFEILEAFSRAHIFAYPANYLETFCISLAEAIFAGCIPVFNAVGALPETSLGFGISYFHEDFDDFEVHERKFLPAINEAFKILDSGGFDPLAQIERAKQSFTLEQFIVSWFQIAAKLI